jgi:LysR family transcriptional activator of nhaA
MSGFTEPNWAGPIVYGRHMLNFNHLYYFHVTASEGSVKAAALRLGVTLPTVSEQIRLLERALGLQLFERSAGGLKLTQAGRSAYEHTSQMFIAGQRLVEALGQTSTSPATTLRVGVSSAISRTMAADFLIPILTVEQCKPSIRTGDFNELLRDLRSHDLDLVLGETEPLNGVASGLESVLVYRPTLIAIAPPGVEPRDNWENLSLLEYRPSSVFHWEIDAFLKERNLLPTCVGELDDSLLMLEAVRRGSFVAFIPRSIARSALKERAVRRIATLPAASVGVHAIFHATDTQQLVRAAIDKLIEGARESADPDE